MCFKPLTWCGEEVTEYEDVYHYQCMNNECGVDVTIKDPVKEVKS
jgi:hypothetical protein